MPKLNAVKYADGVIGWLWYCPACEMPHGGPGWAKTGTDDAPTMNPSYLVRYPHGDPPVNVVCHTFVRNGTIQYLNDCTHHLRGQTVPLPEFSWGD